MHNLELNLKKPELKDIWIELSKSCNHKCNYCFQSTEKGIDNNPNNLTEEQYLNILHQAIQMSINEVGIPGAGEPFHPQNIKLLFKILELNVNHNIHTTIFTHLDFFNEELIQKLNTYGDKITILAKFNSLKHELQDWFDGVKGYGKKRDEVLQLLYKYNFNDNKRLGFVTSVMTKNYDEMPDILRYCRKNNVIPDIDVLLPCGRGKDNPLNPSDDEIRNMYKKLSKIDKKEFGKKWEPTCSYLGEYSCNRYNHHLYIDKEGNVRPCLGAYGVKLGNINTKPLKEMWNSREMRVIQQRMYDGKCTECKKFETKKCNSCLGRFVKNLNNKDLINTGYVHTIGCWGFQEK